MSKEIDINTKIRFILAKIRNLKYYMEIDNISRERAVYMHQMRELRTDILSILDLIDDNRKFKKVVSIIDPKIKNEDCYNTILKVYKLIYE